MGYNQTIGHEVLWVLRDCLSGEALLEGLTETASLWSDIQQGYA